MEFVSYETILIATVIGILPLVVWLYMIYHKSALKSWGVNFLINIFFVGVLTAIPASLLEIFFAESDGGRIAESIIRQFWDDSELSLISPDFLTLTVAAAIEEFSKGLGIFYLTLKKRRSFPNGGLIIGVLVGLSFAITENGVYFASVMNDQLENLPMVIALRFAFSTTAHIVYSGLMGYFVYKAFNAQKKLAFFLGALTVPFVIHFLFNYLLGTLWSWLAVLIVLIGIFVLFNLYRKNKQVLCN